MAGLHATGLDVKPCIFIRKAELKVSDALYEVNERIWVVKKFRTDNCLVYPAIGVVFVLQ